MHCTYECPERQVDCWYCAASVRFVALAEHLRVDCPDAVRRRALAAKAEHGKDLVMCQLCDQMVPRRIEEKHMSSMCPDRLVSCRNEGCGIRLPAKRRKRHEAEWCEAPGVVRLRGLAVRARKLRAYARTWEDGEESGVSTALQ